MVSTTVGSGSVSHRLSTPRAAGLAGVVFAVLFAVTLVLTHGSMPLGAGAAGQWSTEQSRALTTATVLMPFAGISFLWFVAVVRDGFGRMEDRFYATVFLGSGLLFVAMMFVATAAIAGLVAVGAQAGDSSAHAMLVEFAAAVAASASKTYALRMAAVFMISLATIWTKTALMPRWLALTTYLAALTLLVISDLSTWAAMAFPVWVLVVSALVLRRAHHIDASRTPPQSPQRHSYPTRK